jgi:hypothetical protein
MPMDAQELNERLYTETNELEDNPSVSCFILDDDSNIVYDVADMEYAGSGCPIFLVLKAQS